MASVLQLSNFDKDFVVICDASRSGLSTLLQQGDGSVAIFSRQIVAWHAKLVMHERELITHVVQLVSHSRPYLWDCVFLIRTDQYSLKYLLDQRLSTTPPTPVGKRIHRLRLSCGLQVVCEQRGGGHALMAQIRVGCIGVGINDTHVPALQRLAPGARVLSYPGHIEDQGHGEILRPQVVHRRQLVYCGWTHLCSVDVTIIVDDPHERARDGIGGHATPALCGFPCSRPACSDSGVHLGMHHLSTQQKRTSISDGAATTTRGTNHVLN
jgi:hypothetical protein